MALVFYTQSVIDNMDINDIPEGFFNYFEGLPQDAKARIIESRPDLAEPLGYHVEDDLQIEGDSANEKSDSDEYVEATSNIEVSSVNEESKDSLDEDSVIDDIADEIKENIYSDLDMYSLIDTAVTPVHVLTIPDDQETCMVHRKKYDKIQFKYKVKGRLGNASYGFQPYCCSECHRLFLMEKDVDYYAKKFEEHNIAYKSFGLKDSQKYLRTQIKEIELDISENLYVPDVWVEENPICPIHNTRLSEYPHAYVSNGKRISFKGYICEECNNVMVRRAAAIDIQEQCYDYGIESPNIEKIRPIIEAKKVFKQKIRPQFMIEDGKRSEFTYGEANSDVYKLSEDDTLVVSDSSYCYLDGHETEQIEAVYTVKEKRGGNKTYISIVGYCNQCQKFYMDEADYRAIYSYGRPECTVVRDLEDDEYLVTSGAVYDLENSHLNNLESKINSKVDEITSSSDYVSQTETASDYESISALQYLKSVSRDKYEPRLEELYSMRNVPYRYRVDIVFHNKTETYYIGAKEIILDNDKKVISMASNMGRTLINTRTVHYIKNGMQYDVKLSREFDIVNAYLYGYKNIKTDEDAVFRAGITDPFLVKVLNQRKRQHALVDIFVTIQENQNNIVDENISNNIIVQGCAGSGKTMVMLHRLYTLQYNHPDFDFSKALILTPNEQFSLHIKGLAESLQIGNIDRLSVEEYYLNLVKRYSDSFSFTGKIRSEVSVKRAFVDYIYSDQFLDSFYEAYDMVLAQRNNLIPMFEAVYSGLNETFSDVSSLQPEQLMPELKRRHTHLAVMLQKNEKNIEDAKALLDSLLKDKGDIEKRLTAEKQKADTIIEEVLPNVYLKLNAYVASIQKKIDEYDKEIADINKQINEAQGKIMLLGKKTAIEKLEGKLNSIQRKKVKESKKIEEAKEVIAFDITDKTEGEIISWIRSTILIDKSIQNEVLQITSAKKSYQDELQAKIDIELNIVEAEDKFILAKASRYPEDVYKAVNYIGEYLDVPNGIFKLIFEAATKDIREQLKMNMPTGVHRYDLYAMLLFNKKYYDRTVGDATYICFDEGQDLAFNEYKLIKALNSQDVIFNIFGDTNQLLKIGRGIESWDDLQKAFSMKIFYLNENYRNTNQITKFCNQSFGMKVKQTGVDGAKIKEISRKELEKELALLNITTERIAILISRKIPKKNYLEREILPEIIRNAISDKIDNGLISFMYVDEVKGIEFDKVFVVPNKMGKNEKYIAYTRALSELIVVVDDNVPDAVEDAVEEETESTSL